MTPDKELLYLEELIGKHTENLYKLELQAAGYGSNVPLALTNEIEATHQKIKQLNDRYREIFEHKTRLQQDTLVKRRYSKRTFWKLRILPSLFITVFILVIFIYLVINLGNKIQNSPVLADSTTIAAHNLLKESTSSTGDAKLLYKGIIFCSDRDGNQEIYLFDTDNNSQLNLSNKPDANDEFPSWSPDGTRIAFSSNSSGNADIYVLNIFERNLKQITFNNNNDSYPTWSPDGEFITFASDRDGDWEVYTLPLNKTDENINDLKRVTDNDSQDTFPSWSPDGRKIAFQSNRDTNWEIYIIDINGDELQNISQYGGEDSAPSWSPTGNYLAFASSRSGTMDIYVYEIRNSVLKAVIQTPTEDRFPTWSPDENYIAFQSRVDDTSNFVLYNVHIRTGGLERLTEDNLNNFQPNWSRSR